MDPFKCSHEILTDKTNGLLQLMYSNNRVYSIHTCLKPSSCQSWLLWYVLEATPVLGKCSKFEKMCDCNYSFVIEKDPFVEWVTATGMVKKLNIFENKGDWKSLIQRNTVLLEILDNCKRSPRIKTVALKYMASVTP